MSDLKDLIQKKKESKDYFTIQNGMVTELECFEAIEAIGHRQYVLKEELEKRIKGGEKPEDSQVVQSLVIAIQSVHDLQLKVINDVCERFEVIHPKLVNPDPELLKLKQPYWDWYRDMYKKYYGRPAPVVEV